MKQLIQRAYRGQMGAYLQFFVLLLLVSALILVAMAISGCDDCDDDDTDVEYSAYSRPKKLAGGHSPVVIGAGVVQPGGKVDLKIRPDTRFNSNRTIKWTPPPGATNFEFPGAQPEPGGPPFIFKNIGPHDEMQVGYTAPPKKGTLVDTVQSTYADGSSSSVSFETEVTANAALLTAPPAPVGRSPAPTLPQAQVNAWKVGTWLEPKGIALTTELCQEWVDKLKGDDFFLAARMPMTTTAITASYRLPFVFGDPYSQTLHLQSYTNTHPFHLTATLEYRPERHTFLANEMPQAAGEHWVALGISTTEPVSCPAGLNVPMNGWGLEADLWLDLHDQPNACAGCAVLVYGCYEGQNPPAGLAAQALARTMGIESYQGEGITCFGPKPTFLAGGGLHFGGIGTAAITPTQPITLHQIIENRTGDAVTLTLAYTSTVSNWRFYTGDWDAPDTGSPIIPGATEIVISNQDAAFMWVVNNPVPADTPDGPHSLVLTVTSTTSPTLTTWDAVPLWSGGWVAPPPAGTGYRIYLPLVVKSG